VSAFKVETAALRAELLDYNIAGFVAHEDIAPTAEWQREIVRALREMDVLTTLLTEGFAESRWTSQEVGWAFGRQVPVVSIRYSVDPFGFMGMHQALMGRGKTVPALAEELVRVFLRHPEVRDKMGEALAARLARSMSYSTSQRLVDLLESATSLTPRASDIIERGFRANTEIRLAAGVPETLSRLLGRELAVEV
jgi:hypothetical protein